MKAVHHKTGTEDVKHLPSLTVIWNRMKCIQGLYLLTYVNEPGLMKGICFWGLRWGLLTLTASEKLSSFGTINSGLRKPKNSNWQAAQIMQWSGGLMSKARKIITMRSSIKLEEVTRRITLSSCNSSKCSLQLQAINKSIRKAQVDMQWMHNTR